MKRKLPMPWNLLYVYENHVHRNAMTGIHSSMKMTPRRGSRMISKAERRLEKHRRDYMGRVHVYTLLSALPRIFPSLPVSSDLRLHSFSSSSFCYFFLPLHIWRARRAQFTSTPPTDYLLLPFRKTIFNRQHFYSNPLYVKRSYWKRNAHLVCVWEVSIIIYWIINRIIF